MNEDFDDNFGDAPIRPDGRLLLIAVGVLCLTVIAAAFIEWALQGNGL